MTLLAKIRQGTAIAIATGTLVFAAGQVAAEKTLKLASIAPENSVWNEMLMLYANRVDELSGGELKLDVFAGGQLGNMADTMSQTLRGRIDIWTGPAPVMASLAPEIAVITLPYQFESDAEANCVLPKLSGPIREALGGKGAYITSFPMGYNDVSGTMEVRVPEDIAGEKIRTSANPVSNALVKAYGANPVPMNPVETVSALSTGLVSGGDSALPFWFTTGQHKTASYLLRTRHYKNVAGMVVGPRTWKDLSDAEKKILEDATDAIPYETTQAMLDQFEVKVTAGAIKQGATISEPNPEELAKWKQRGKAIWEPIIGKLGKNGAAFNDVVQAEKAACAG